MKTLLMLGGAVATGVAGFLYKASQAKPEFELRRSILTSASTDEVYAVLSVFGKYSQWNPWGELDPKMAVELSGEAGEIGSSYAWDGNNKAGAGKMIVVEAHPSKEVVLSLDFVRPFPASNTVIWRVTDEGEQRRIDWIMRGTNDTVFKRAFGLLFMERMAGKDFEKGLRSLKSLVEKTAA